MTSENALPKVTPKSSNTISLDSDEDQDTQNHANKRQKVTDKTPIEID